MASTTGFIEKWSKFCLGRNNRTREESAAAVAGAAAGPSEVHHPPRSIALRAEVAHRWVSVAAGRGAFAGGSCAAVAAGAGAGVGGAGIGAAGAAGVASVASGVGAGSAVFAAGVGAAAAGATAAGAAAAGGVGGDGSVVAGAADVGPAAAGMGACAAAGAGVSATGAGASAAAGADLARTNTPTPVPHAAEALQTKPPAAIPQPTKPAAAGVAESAISSRRALEEKVAAGSAGHGDGVQGAAVGKSADESSLLGASVLRMLEQARKALGGGQGGRRLPVEHVREVVAMWEEEEEKGGCLVGGRRSTLRGVTSVETVKALFSGWVESGALFVLFRVRL